VVNKEKPELKKMVNVWLDQLTEFDHVGVYIRKNLDVLKSNAQVADFTDTATKTQYMNDILFLQQFFERAEILARRRAENGG
jgi:hypothetical protein